MAKKLSSNTIDTLYQEVSSIITEARNIVYQTANFEMVKAYWNIGKKIVEQEQQGEGRAEYGTQLVKGLSNILTKEYGKGFDKTNLWNMRKFYTSFQKIDALRQELSWTHYRILLRVDNNEARDYYINECIIQKWSTRTLQRQLNTQYYERIISSNTKVIPSIPVSKNELEQIQPSDTIKDPYVLEFINVKPYTKIHESILEQALMDQLQEFLLELGKGFSFVGRQYKVNAETEHFYIDLVFYNYHLKCFILIDLKTGKLNHSDIGQMDFYVRYFEDQIKLKGDNPTIGSILCAEKDNAIAKYSLLSESKQIFASKYKTYLPSEEELQKEIARGRYQIEIEKKLRE